jgi:hypothetical protein
VPYGKQVLSHFPLLLSWYGRAGRVTSSTNAEARIDSLLRDSPEIL